MKTETSENASFSMETPKMESFENANNSNLYNILGFKTSANKGNENEQKRSNGNTPVFVPGALGENGVMETVQDHPKTEFMKTETFENGVMET